jgi:hypothetical protein
MVSLLNVSFEGFFVNDEMFWAGGICDETTHREPSNYENFALP